MAADGPSGPVPGDDPARQPQPPPAWQNRPPTGAYPQPAYGAPPPSRRPGAGWWIGAALVAAVLGVGGYLVGHSVGQSNERDNFDAGAPGYDVIYQQGFAAGKGEGTQQGQAQGAAQGEQTGLEQGEQTGLEQGKQQGEQQGFKQGTSAGATQALGGFTTWAPGAPYVVKVKAGSSSVPYQISSRTQMQPDTDYALCQDDPSQVCTVKAASDTGSKSGTDTTTP
jgi:hypothetical protein